MLKKDKEDVQSHTHTKRSRMFCHTNQCKIEIKGQMHEDEITCTESYFLVSRLENGREEHVAIIEPFLLLENNTV